MRPLFGAVLLTLVVGCIGRSELGLIAQPRGDDADSDLVGAIGDTGALDWRQMNPAQWALFQDEWQRSAALGTSGPPTIRLIGPDFGGTQKWTGTELGANGKLYGIPEDARFVLEIDPSQEPPLVQTVGPDLGGTQGKWFGGTLHSDGVIYCAPYAGAGLLKIDTNTDPVTVTVDPFRNGWFFSVRVPTGLLVVRQSLDFAAAFTPPLNDVLTYATLPAPLTFYSAGGVRALPTTGEIVVVPYENEHVLLIDSAGASIVSSGYYVPNPTGRWFGIAVAPNGNLYAAPTNARHFLAIDTSVSPPSVSEMTDVAFGCDGLVGDPAGRLFCLPWNTDEVPILDPATGVVSTYVVPYVAFSARYAGGALHPNGKIYAAPSGDAQVLEIDPHALGTLSRDAVLGAYMNGY